MERVLLCGIVGLFLGPSGGRAHMNCRHCNGYWTVRIGDVLVWCSCEAAQQKRAEEPTWLYFASALRGKALEARP